MKHIKNDCSRDSGLKVNIRRVQINTLAADCYHLPFSSVQKIIDSNLQLERSMFLQIRAKDVPAPNAANKPLLIIIILSLKYHIFLYSNALAI